MQNKVDSLIAARSQLGEAKAFHLLMEAQNYWNQMARFRAERERNKRYTYGDQWGDLIDFEGEKITEKEYIKRQGSIPLTNNLIRRLVRSIVGVYRSQNKEPTCAARDRGEQKISETMSTILQYNMQLNRMKDIYARSLEAQIAAFNLMRTPAPAEEA